MARFSPLTFCQFVHFHFLICQYRKWKQSRKWKTKSFAFLMFSISTIYASILWSIPFTADWLTSTSQSLSGATLVYRSWTDSGESGVHFTKPKDGNIQYCNILIFRYSDVPIFWYSNIPIKRWAGCTAPSPKMGTRRLAQRMVASAPAQPLVTVTR